MQPPFSDNYHSQQELEADSRRLAEILGKELPEGVGFQLFVFGFGEEGNLAYISNAQREDCILAVREWLCHVEQGEMIDPTQQQKLEIRKESPGSIIIAPTFICDLAPILKPSTMARAINGLAGRFRAEVLRTLIREGIFDL